MSNNIEKLTLNVEEAGKMLGISRPTAYERVQDGSIPSIKLGRRILVPRIALERMLNGQKEGKNE